MSENNLPIPTSYWVIPGRFLAGEYPASLDLEQTRQRLGAFLAAGLDTFFDLTVPGELPSYLPVLHEQADRRRMKVHYRRFPIPDLGVPSREEMLLILEAIDSALGEGRKIYLHCWGGIGRTGTVVGCYVVRHGLSGKEALVQLGRLYRQAAQSRWHPISPQTDAQWHFILKWKEED